MTSIDERDSSLIGTFILSIVFLSLLDVVYPYPVCISSLLTVSVFLMKFLFQSEKSMFRNENSLEILYAVSINWNHIGRQSTEFFLRTLPLFNSIFAPPAPTRPFCPSIKSSDCSLTDLRVRTVQHRYL